MDEILFNFGAVNGAYMLCCSPNEMTFLLRDERIAIEGTYVTLHEIEYWCVKYTYAIELL